jgi:hypothetical protein
MIRPSPLLRPPGEDGSSCLIAGWIRRLKFHLVHHHPKRLFDLPHCGQFADFTLDLPDPEGRLGRMT